MEKWITDSGLKGKVNMLDFSLPEIIKKGIDNHVSVKIEGSVTNGFIDLLIFSADGQEYDFRDPNSWKVEQYSSDWTFNIPNHAPNGNYKAYLLLHEIANGDRILMCKEKELQLI
jgi:hypothetical protein